MSMKPQVEHVGTLSIPVSGWKLGQIFLWIQRKGYERGEECPFDASVLPEKYGNQLSEDEDFFYAFREVRLEETEGDDTRPRIVLIFNRLRLKMPSKVEQEAATDSSVAFHEALALEAQRILVDEHGVVINLKFLTEALQSGDAYFDIETPEELVSRVMANVYNPVAHLK